MSMDYQAYFHLKHSTLNINKLQNFLRQYGLIYEDRPSYFVVNDETLMEELHQEYADWLQFVFEINHPNRAPNAVFVHELFDLMLGFVTIGSKKLAILEISEGNLDKLAHFMRQEKKANVLHFLSSLYEALVADSMVWGIELAYKEAVQFMKGSLTEEIAKDSIRAAVGVSSSSLALLRTFEGQNVIIGNNMGVSRWFLGLDSEMKFLPISLQATVAHSDSNAFCSERLLTA